MKSWTMFLPAIGFLLIMVSPQLPWSMGYLAVGLVLVLIGAIRLKKEKKKGKE